jgi:hypothetical protein
MKRIISFLWVICLGIHFLSCSPKIKSGKAVLNLEKLDDEGRPMLIGPSSRERLEQAPFGDWFNPNYTGYTVDSGIVKHLRPLIPGKQFLIFMGTWCGDSRREVPRIFKILDCCGVSPTQIRLVTLSDLQNEYKQSPGHEERNLDIHRVPDLLVFDGKKEIGRIVESPVYSLEKDLQAILLREPYPPHYRLVALLSQLFRSQPLAYLETDLPGLVVKAKELAAGPFELNTYGYVLMAAREYEKSKLVFTMNTMVYPENPNVYISLAQFYLRTGHPDLARENLEKAIQIQPDNKEAQKNLDLLKRK